MKRSLVALALALALAACACSAAPASPRPIQVYLDGKLVAYYSQLLDSHITAGVLVEGQPMVAERFLAGMLPISTTTYMLQRWGVFELNEWAFKVGDSRALRAVATFGGGGWTEEALPVPPMILRDNDADRLYVPALPTLELLGCKPRWDAAASALYLTKPAPPTRTAPH